MDWVGIGWDGTGWKLIDCQDEATATELCKQINVSGHSAGDLCCRL